MISVPTAIGYGHWIAPGAPAERDRALRDAYSAALKDPELLADAKQSNIEIVFTDGEAVKALVQRATNTPIATRAKAADILQWQ